VSKMRLVTFKLLNTTNTDNATHVGALLNDDERILDFHTALASTDMVEHLVWFDIDGKWFKHAQELYEEVTTSVKDSDAIAQALVNRSDVQLLAPIPRPGKIVCVGRNYKEHAEETGASIPESPIIFSKFSTAVTGPGQPVVLPPESNKSDYEAELAVIIGRRAKHVSRETALDYVFGYMNFNDVTERGFQSSDKQWQRGKSCDTFAPMGEYIATKDEINDPHDLSIKMRLNGEVMQDSNTSRMIFSIHDLIAFITTSITLEPGDVIATGTPPGVGMARKPPVFLKAGDIMEVEISGLGKLTNPVESSV
jgi:2-keto-4-pentenoate hydratase/2-oxohepta-3-ene-1,7-dioic acid hydratase in catechol pathway